VLKSTSPGKPVWLQRRTCCHRLDLYSLQAPGTGTPEVPSALLTQAFVSINRMMQQYLRKYRCPDIVGGHISRRTLRTRSSIVSPGYVMCEKEERVENDQKKLLRIWFTIQFPPTLSYGYVMNETIQRPPDISLALHFLGGVGVMGVTRLLFLRMVSHFWTGNFCLYGRKTTVS
jgi:hypothetical protein